MPAFDVAGSACGLGTTVDVTGPNVGSGANRALIVGIAQGNSAVTLTSVTWDQGGADQAMTRIGAIDNGTDARIELWRLVAPTSEAKMLRVVSPSSVGMSISMVAYTAVDQSTPNDTASVNNGLSSTPSLSVSTTTSDGLVVNVVAQKETAGANKTSGQTERAEQHCNGDDEAVYASDEPGTGGSVSMNWSGGGTEEWASVGANLRNAAGTEFTITTGLDAALQADVEISAILSGALQRQDQSITASIAAALQKEKQIAASLDARLQSGQSISVSVDAALAQQDQLTTAILDAALQRESTIAATLEAALVANVVVTTSLDANLSAGEFGAAHSHSGRFVKLGAKARRTVR